MQFIEANSKDQAGSGLRDLIALSLFQPNDAKIASFIERIDTRNSSVFLAIDGQDAVGQLTVTRGTGGTGVDRDVTIDSISVLESRQRKGIGRFLVRAYLAQFPGSVLFAETDDDAVGFYHYLGFRIRSLGEPFPGRVRYRCTYDDGAWEPVPCAEAFNCIRSFAVRCWVAGGWALDLFHGRETRVHDDTDILVCRSDQDRLHEIFRGWELFRTHAPGLGYWSGTPRLDTTPNVWLRRNSDSPWALEIMFLDVQGDDWIYRRNPAVRGKLDEMSLTNEDGISYLRPEIQLLYKGGSSARREKDTMDLLRILPILPTASRAWLAHALRTQFPAGHEWLAYLEGSPATRAPR